MRGISDHSMIESIYFRDPNGYVIEVRYFNNIDPFCLQNLLNSLSCTASSQDCSSRWNNESREKWSSRQAGCVE